MAVGEHRLGPGLVDVTLTAYGRAPAAIRAAALESAAGVVTISSDDSDVADD